MPEKLGMIDTLDLRNGIQKLIATAPAGGLWTDASTEALTRNSFCFRLEPEGPIYTAMITVGGSMHVSK